MEAISSGDVSLNLKSILISIALRMLLASTAISCGAGLEGQRHNRSGKLDLEQPLPLPFSSTSCSWLFRDEMKLRGRRRGEDL